MIITAKTLRKISKHANKAVIDDLEVHLAPALLKYNIHTPLRVAHFLAQAAHESAHFRTLEEYASGAAYEGRRDLGNTRAGDGVRFKGRGIFQLTGRANYTQMSDRLGVDIVNNPHLAATARISVMTACEYWNTRNLSRHADADDVRMVTRLINGGFNGLADRIKYLEISKQLLPEIFPNVPGTFRPYFRGSKGTTVRSIQAALNKRGANLLADGDFGPATERAVMEFQARSGMKVTGIVDEVLFKALGV